jgi:hypothetical protein
LGDPRPVPRYFVVRWFGARYIVGWCWDGPDAGRMEFERSACGAQQQNITEVRNRQSLACKTTQQFV